MYQKAQQVQLTLFPPMYLDIVIADGGWEKRGNKITLMKLPSSYFFGLLFINLKLGTHTK